MNILTEDEYAMVKKLAISRVRGHALGTADDWAHEFLVSILPRFQAARFESETHRGKWLVQACLWRFANFQKATGKFERRFNSYPDLFEPLRSATSDVCRMEANSGYQPGARYRIAAGKCRHCDNPRINASECRACADKRNRERRERRSALNSSTRRLTIARN